MQRNKARRLPCSPPHPLHRAAITQRCSSRQAANTVGSALRKPHVCCAPPNRHEVRNRCSFFGDRCSSSRAQTAALRLFPLVLGGVHDEASAASGRLVPTPPRADSTCSRRTHTCPRETGLGRTEGTDVHWRTRSRPSPGREDQKVTAAAQCASTARRLSLIRYTVCAETRGRPAQTINIRARRGRAGEGTRIAAPLVGRNCTHSKSSQTGRHPSLASSRQPVTPTSHPRQRRRPRPPRPPALRHLLPARRPACAGRGWRPGTRGRAAGRHARGGSCSCWAASNCRRCSLTARSWPGGRRRRPRRTRKRAFLRRTEAGPRPLGKFLSPRSAGCGKLGQCLHACTARPIATTAFIRRRQFRGRRSRDLGNLQIRRSRPAACISARLRSLLRKITRSAAIPGGIFRDMTSPPTSRDDARFLEGGRTTQVASVAVPRRRHGVHAPPRGWSPDTWMTRVAARVPRVHVRGVF